MSEQHVFYSSVHPSEGQRRYTLPGLDGLRAVAVMLVLVYHLWPGALPGGMIGVDVFFVISGYLITALLMREGAYTGKVRLPAFWLRRLRRLIPAVFVLVAVVGSVALMVGGDAKVGLGRQVLGAFTYSSNWLYIAHDSDYFAQTSPELLTNFWSLAVEEQFYVFWPIIFVFACMFLGKWWQRSIVPAALGLISVILSAILLATGSKVDRVYYGTDSHLYGLMLGVTLAFLIPWSMYPPSDRRLFSYIGYGNGVWGLVRGLVGWVCLLGLVPLALVITMNNAAFMPWMLLLASLMAVGIIQALFADAQHPLSTALRWVLLLPPLVWVGRRSYGIYLWHWPIFVLAHYMLGADASPVRSWVVLLLSFIIAGLSYMYVEQPVRELGFRGALASWKNALIHGPSKVFSRVTAGLLAVGVICTAIAIATAPSMTSAQQVVAAAGGEEQSVKVGPKKTMGPTAAASPSASASASASAKATSSASPSASASTAPGTFSDPVTIVGDSVTVAATPALQEDIPQATIDAKVSRTIVQGEPILQQMLSDGEMSDYVVIALTTNSTMNQDMLEELVKELSPDGKRKFVFVTGVAPANLTWVAQSNEAIYATAKAHPDQVFVADWAKTGAGHPEWLASDGVHPQAEGQNVYAQTVTDALNAAKKASK